MEIDEGVLVDDWKTFIANTINIDKSRINYHSFNNSSLSIHFTISESENDNLQELYQSIQDNYHTISLKYPYLYNFE
jgi:hypothetical protein